MSIAELSLKRPVTTIMLFVSMFVIGLIAAVRLPLEALPSLSFSTRTSRWPFSGSWPAFLRSAASGSLSMPGNGSNASGFTLPSARSTRHSACGRGALRPTRVRTSWNSS